VLTLSCIDVTFLDAVLALAAAVFISVQDDGAMNSAQPYPSA
jgi:hypothetical protein